jgi:hypothetical protein
VTCALVVSSNNEVRNGHAGVLKAWGGDVRVFDWRSKKYLSATDMAHAQDGFEYQGCALVLQSELPDYRAEGPSRRACTKSCHTQQQCQILGM